MGSSIGYILGSFSKVFQIFSGLSFFTQGGIGKSIRVLGDGSTHFDMRNGQDTVYSGWSIMWWLSVISSVLINLFNIIFFGFSFSYVRNILLGCGIGLIVYAFMIMKGRQNDTHWKSWIVKVLIVLHAISVIGYIILICINVIGALIGFIGSLVFIGVKHAICTVLTIIVHFVVNIANIFVAFYILNGLSMAMPSNNGYNQNVNNSYNGYNQNMNGVSGLGGVNSQNQYQNQGSFNVYGNTQTYACPYCGNPVSQGVSPCPHCNNYLNWS